MKKRLRKKLCVGEFAQMGFELNAEYPEKSPEELDAFMKEFFGKLDEFDMDCGGEFSNSCCDLFVCTGVVGSDEAKRRDGFAAWLNSVSGVKAKIGELVDANYDK